MWNISSLELFSVNAGRVDDLRANFDLQESCSENESDGSIESASSCHEHWQR